MKERKSEIKRFLDIALWIMTRNLSVILSDSGKINISFQLFFLPGDF